LKIKKYIVRNMQEALKLIREDLGPDAVIISNYKMPRRNFADWFTPRMLEVTAALDDHKKTIHSSPQRMIDGGEQNAREFLQILSGFNPGQVIRRVNRRGYGDIAPKLSGATNLMVRKGVDDGATFDTILKNKGNFLVDREINKLWKKILKRLEIQESIVENLLHGLSEASDRQSTEDWHEEYRKNHFYEADMVFLKNKIARLLEPAYRLAPPKKINVFVGPAGVGKTLTMAKLALHYKVFENKNIVFISAGENNRPGHLETLMYYANMAEAPVECARNKDELLLQIEKHLDKDLIMVDTNGVNPKNTGMMLKLNSLVKPLGAGHEIYLVMSSATKNADLIRSATEYSKVGYTKLIFTKIDETDTCGSILNVVCRMGVPVVFVSYGQNVPDDITAVNPKRLAGLLLKGVDRFVEQGFQSRA